MTRDHQLNTFIKKYLNGIAIQLILNPLKNSYEIFYLLNYKL